MIFFGTQMIHLVVAIWCWLLTFGISCALPELGSVKRAANRTSASGLIEHAKQTSHINGLQNNSKSFETPMVKSTVQYTTTSTAATPVHSLPKPGAGSHSISKYPAKKGSPEKVFVPVQISEQPRFTRVKHGPQKNAQHSKFVLKTKPDVHEVNKTDARTWFNRSADLDVSSTHHYTTANKSKRQQHRKKIVSIGIPASSHLVGTTRTTTGTPSTAKTTTAAPPADSDEYYSSYAEYPDFAPNAYNSSGCKEDGILPDPDLNAEEDVGEPETEALIPDDSLADTDLHDHDLIDSVMYIYFGASDRNEGGVGKQVMIVGMVLSFVVHFFTVACGCRRLRTRPDDYCPLIMVNAEVSNTLSCLIFVFGIQARDRSYCLTVATALHYLYLATCCWYFVNCIDAYRRVQNPEHRTKIRLYCILAWASPALVVMTCFLFNQRGYEIRSYCWMSLEKGMLYSFMIPVSILILLNTLFAVMGLRKVSMLKTATDSDRKSLRVAATLLPMFAVAWFLAVVALENSTSLIFSLLFQTTHGFMSWFTIACWLPPELVDCKEADEDYDDEDDDLYEDVAGMLKHQQSMTDVLLDDSVYVCGRRDACELQMDPICTISS